MRSIQIACCLILFSFLMAGCQKTDFDNNPTGEGIETGTFRIQSPSSQSTIALNSATPAEPVVLRWTSAKPGVDKEITYKWIAVQKGGDINNFKFELPADNNGKATTLTITQEKLDLFLFSKGVPNKGSIELEWTIQASNGETQVVSQDLFFLTLKRFSDGATPFMLYGPEPINEIATIDPTSTADVFNFKWQKSVPTAGSPAVKYRVVFDHEGGDFSDPIFSIESNNSGSDSSLQMTYKQLSDSLDDNDVKDLTKENRIKWAVQAITGDWVQLSSYENAMNILRQVRFYIVGDFEGWPHVWDINNPMQLIPDKAPGRYSKVFYAYLKLKAGDVFKFFKTKGNWESGYGLDGGSDGEYNTGYNRGGNIEITADGIYRATIDVENNKIYIQNHQVGTIGIPDWEAPSFSKGYMIEHNKFMFLVGAGGEKEFKFKDAADWDESGPNKTRVYGQLKDAPVGLIATPGDNARTAPSPVSRIIWDGTDPQLLKYTVEEARMYLIGDATEGGWENLTTNDKLPELIYQGNGLWKLTNVPLKANKEFKFILKKGSWEFDFGSTADQPAPLTGEIKQGGANIGVTTAGNYTVELNEYTRTYKVY